MLHLFQIFLILVYNRNRPAPANATVFCDTYTGLGDGGRGKGFLIFAVHGKIVQVQKISIITREGRVQFPGGGLEDSVISRGWANWPETKSLLWRGMELRNVKWRFWIVRLGLKFQE